MITTTPISPDIIKAERDIGSGQFNIHHPLHPLKPLEPVVNSNDPENFLKRCSGYSKKTSLRCSANIGKKTQRDNHFTYLPTCSAHRDQQSLAGWCQFRWSNGERCGRLFRWKPPHFELCVNHQGHPSTPCYFLKQLPLELRHEIYRYLLPTETIDSSTAAVHNQAARETSQVASYAAIRSCDPYSNSLRGSRTRGSKFPMRLLDLLMVSRQVHAEVKRLLFSIVTFKIDVRKDGTFMCGRRLLEPKRADGSSHFFFGQTDHAKKKFLKSFDWAAAKNYAVDVLLENCLIANPHHAPNNVNMTMKSLWDEEVEIYDIRDYISVVVSGILAKAANLNKLQVRLCVADFAWDQDQILSNAKLLFSPFERLRNVRQPTLLGVYNGRPDGNSMYPIERGTGRYSIAALNGCTMQSTLPAYYELCSVPSLPTNEPVLLPGMPEFDTYSAKWTDQISSTGSTNVTQEPMIRTMFTEFRNFYAELSNQVPEITLKTGRYTFLHRARVAREQEDVIAFRAIRKELLEHWDRYLDNQEQKKRTMEARIAKFLQSDTYPSHIWEDVSEVQQESLWINQEPQAPTGLDSEVIARDGIPMTGNVVRQSYDQPPYQQMNPHPVQHSPYWYPKLPTQAAEKLNISSLRHIQAQVLQREIARQRMQMQQLQQLGQYSPASAMPRHQDYMLKRKATDESNAQNDQGSNLTQQSDDYKTLSRGVSRISQSGCENASINERDDYPFSSSNPSTNNIKSSLESTAGPSTKRLRVDYSSEDAGTNSTSGHLQISPFENQADGFMTCDMLSSSCDSHVMEASAAGKGKGKWNATA